VIITVTDGKSATLSTETLNSRALPQHEAVELLGAIEREDCSSDETLTLAENIEYLRTFGVTADVYRCGIE
jgi:DNA-directed RNA polymerase subunit F